MNKTQFEIRSATINDASDLSELSGQLGYPTSDLEIKDRLNSMLSSNDHVVYVAFEPNGRTVGWIHVFKSQRVESESFAEIGGLIVSEAFRRKGIGKKLVKAAEEWTLQKKLPKLRVRSKLEREGAKRFYSNLGFSISKQQRVFDKTMNHIP
jgi:GNAT superfamily N-acetyltransferase